MSVHAADLDGNGRTDVLSASLADDKIAWYENRIGSSGSDSDGFGPEKVVTRHAEFATSVSTADLDGDGDLDILSASSYDDKIAWYENKIGEPGADGDGFGAQQVITTQADGAQSVVAADLDGDGDPDVLSASANDDRVAWYENHLGEVGADSDGFGSAQTISDNASVVYDLAVADLDGDGDPDVLSAASFDDKVAWYENELGEENADEDGFSAERIVTSDAEGAVSVSTADVDGDGDPDVVSASSYDDTIAWYQNQIVEEGADSDGFGALQVISTEAHYASSVTTAQLNGDLAIDVLSASRSDDKIAWYENQVGDTDGGFGAQRIITTEADEAQSVFTADVDRDGKPDILSASSNDDKIAWYRNSEEALPVELTGFRATQRQTGAVELSWRTASETGNAQFDVQRGRRTIGGREWEKIGEVAGHGTTSISQQYRFVDRDLPFAADSLWYRLRQIDVDGSTHLSQPVAIDRAVRTVQLVDVYPNPASTQVTVRITRPGRREATLTVYDVLGRPVQTLSLSGSAGRTEAKIKVTDVPTGTYFLRLSVGDETRSERFTVVH